MSQPTQEQFDAFVAEFQRLQAKFTSTTTELEQLKLEKVQLEQRLTNPQPDMRRMVESIIDHTDRLTQSIQPFVVSSSRKTFPLTLDNFDGSKDNLIPWLSDVELKLTVSHIPGEEWSLWTRTALKGIAKQHIENHIELLQNQGKSMDWNTMKKLLIERFIPKSLHLVLRDKLLQLRQSGSDISNYIHQFQTIANQLDKGIAVDDLIYYFSRGLRSQTKQHVYLANPRTLQAAIDLALSFENAASSSHPTPMELGRFRPRRTWHPASKEFTVPQRDYRQARSSSTSSFRRTSSRPTNQGMPKSISFSYFNRTRSNPGNRPFHRELPGRTYSQNRRFYRGSGNFRWHNGVNEHQGGRNYGRPYLYAKRFGYQPRQGTQSFNYLSQNSNSQNLSNLPSNSASTTNFPPCAEFHNGSNQGNFEGSRTTGAWNRQ